MQRLNMQRLRTGLAATAVVAIGAVLASAAAAATPVNGSVAGPVVAVKGKTFTVTTTLSPTGKSTATVTSKTTITTQETGKLADVKKGVCVMATGTKKGTAVAATRVTITTASGGQCGQRPGGGGGRPGGGGTPPGGGLGGGGGGGAGPPANFGIANGTVSAVKGSTVTVKGRQGTTTVTLSSKTVYTKSVSVGGSAITTKACAFVRGTSADKGVTISAQNVSLSKPVSGKCTTPGRRGP
jgi:hypothetical protein